MQLANTTTVLNIVNYIVGTRARYADRGANNTRLLVWGISKHNTNMYLKEVQDIFTLAGFTNRIKVTQSRGATYLRINASYNK